MKLVLLCLVSVLGAAAAATTNGRRRAASRRRPSGAARIDRFCTKSPPFGSYSFCTAYKFLPKLVENEEIGKGFIDYYWGLVARGKDVLTLQTARYHNGLVTKYHDQILKANGIANFGRRPNFRSVFSAVDRTIRADGRITQDEVFKHLQNRPIPWVVLVGFQHLDTNEDGFLSQDEINKPYCEVSRQLIQKAKEAGKEPPLSGCWGDSIVTDGRR